MTEWICPRCDRLFGRSGQSHDCAPGLSLEEYFETGPAHERPIFDVVMGHVANVRTPEEVDAKLLDLLTEAYLDEPS
ncbi:MAG TPA: hypothetical protein VMW33_07395 [Ilumatobacteraceae bacterium]|jgi:hypothetical protein|nr:hypothetical protein [Ilumatobacteraceae bacterium]